MSPGSGAEPARGRRPQLAAAAFASLHGYRRAWASADLRAAVTLLVIAVPEQLATARLAGMPPISGLYAFVAGSLLIAILGSSPQMSVGADSTIAPLFAVGVSHLAAVGSGRYVELVGILAVMTGVLVALVWLLRLGWVAEFLSAPIIAGFLAGIAVIIVVHQLPDLFGVAAPSGSTVHRFLRTIGRLGGASGWTIGIGAGVFGSMLAADRIDRRLPGALFGLVAATALVAAAGLRSDGVAVLGAVARSAPPVGLRGLSASTVANLAPIAGIVAIVVLTQTAATARAFSTRGDHRVDVGRDFLAVGAGSIVAGLVGSFPVNASPPRTAAVAAAGGRTQVASLAAVGAVLLLIPAAGVLKDAPFAAFAGVLLFVATRIFHGRELTAIARFDAVEFGLALITMVAVAFVGVEQGIAVAVGLAILDRARLTARPQLHVLGRIPRTTSWAPVGTQNAAPVEGVLVVLFATPLWYANSVHFRAQLRDALASRTGPIRLVVLDALGMTDLDYTGAQALAEVLAELERDQIAFAVARAGQHARDGLQRSGLLARIGPGHLFASVDEAVVALAGRVRS